MCRNFKPIKKARAGWVQETFGCKLPDQDWRDEAFPTYSAPFIYLDEDKPKCELAQFGLVPPWAPDKQKFGHNTYNARYETLPDKPSYKSPWKQRSFGLILMDCFFEPSWETGKSIRWGIKRSDNEPTVAASIWERFTDHATGEIIFSFSMITINADGHDVMSHFHKPEDEKRSIVVLNDSEYMPWLHASHEKAKSLLKLAPKDFLVSEPPPIFRQPINPTTSLFAD